MRRSKIVFFILFAFLCMTEVAKPDTFSGTGIDNKEKWLPESSSYRSSIPTIDHFLKALHGNVRILYCKYKGAELVNKLNLSTGTLKVNNEEWQTTVEVNRASEDKTAMDINVRFYMKSGMANESGVAIAFDFTNWYTDNYVMLPASVYNGNRCQIVDRKYASGLDRKYLYQKDIPLMSVPIPQLSPNLGDVSRLEVNVCNMASPAMCTFNKKSRCGFIVLTEQMTELGNNGFSIEESADRKTASFVISAPGVRNKKPLFVGFAESQDRGANMKAGDEINLRLRIYSFPAKDIPAVLEKFTEVRKAVTGKNQPRNLIPFSQVVNWMTERIDARWYSGKDSEFYCPENAKWISFGWIGGLINTFPMIALGDKMHLDRMVKTFDFAIPKAQGESGYFYGALNYDGENFGREGYKELPEIVLTRKNGDVLYWMIKQFMLLKSQNKRTFIKPEWEKSIKRIAEAFVSTWKKNGQWGRMLNNKTGEVAEYNSSGGVMAIGGLALASDYFNEPEYLNIAEAAAGFYYKHDFVHNGATTGGCADILHNADSETAAGFMTSLMALYEITGRKKWLEKSQNLADLVATWTTSYDYELPKESELGKNGAKLAGIYWASTQNKHGAPGICTSSGDALFKIYRGTGNLLYADLMNDIVHAHAESIRPGGLINEKLTYCDAIGDKVGNLGKSVTGWNETNGFLMALELPGIYLQTDGGRLFVFDHVNAEIISQNKDGIRLRITNPTQFDASITVFAETSKKAQKPLGYTAFLDWPKIEVRKGETVDILIVDNQNIIAL